MSNIDTTIVNFIYAMASHNASVVAITVDDATYRRLEDEARRWARWSNDADDKGHLREIVLRTAMRDVTIRNAADD